VVNLEILQHPHRWQRQLSRFKTLWRSAEYDSASRSNRGRLCRTGIGGFFLSPSENFPASFRRHFEAGGAASGGGSVKQINETPLASFVLVCLRGAYAVKFCCGPALVCAIRLHTRPPDARPHSVTNWLRKSALLSEPPSHYRQA